MQSSFAHWPAILAAVHTVSVHVSTTVHTVYSVYFLDLGINHAVFQALFRPSSYRTRSTSQQAYANFGIHYCQWECSHRLQATSKGLLQICVQICSRVLCEQGLRCLYVSAAVHDVFTHFQALFILCLCFRFVHTVFQAVCVLFTLCVCCRVFVSVHTAFLALFILCLCSRFVHTVHTVFQALFILSIIAYEPLKLDDYVYPGWGMVLGWLVTCSSIIPIPLYMIYRFIFKVNGGCFQVSVTTLGFQILIMEGLSLENLQIQPWLFLDSCSCPWEIAH